MNVTLVIPGRNCASTLEACLASVIGLLQSPTSPLAEVLFIDDGSTDETPAIAQKFNITYVKGEGKGPGAARNLGWRRAQNELVWFIDSDTVAAADALDLLVPHMEDPKVGGVSGSYDNAVPESLLACLIHEEIIERHLAMPTEVNFLATFNVIYRREILRELDGFDERYLKAQDAEFSFRVLELGKKLHFEFRSKVAHHHVTQLRKYLRVQRHQGFWRVYLHLEHEGHSTGDSYSSLLDHIQPPLAMLCLAMVPFVIWNFPRLSFLTPSLLLNILLGILFLLQLPLTLRLVKRNKQLRYLAFAPMSFIRAFARGIGMSLGTCHYLLSKKKS